MSKLMKIDDKYRKWIQNISREFRKGQVKAAIKVNEQMLRLYWELGKDISEMSKDSSYGSGFFKSVSSDLKLSLPDVKAFSVTNLHYMVWFYELYSEVVNLPQVGVNSTNVIFKIPWGHNKLIIDKCKHNTEKALFYIRETIQNGWSRAMLLNFLGTDLYERKGKAVSNFQYNLPPEKSDLAQQITKDPYSFDFLTLRESYNEKELKDELMNNLQRFLLELGKGFAFVDREYRMVIGNTEQFLDMLFYNIQLHCYVVIEVKVTAFDPRDMGQLSTYVAAVDAMLRAEGDNQTIGLLVCKDKDDVLAQYAVNNLNTPVGISSYELSHLIPEKFKGSMPSIEEIEAEISGSLKII